jgi:hypothetical protein
MDVLHKYIKATNTHYFNQVKNGNYEAHNVEWIYKTDISATCTYTFYYEGYVNNKYTNGRGRATNVFVKQISGG